MKILKIFGQIILFGGGIIVVLLVFSALYHNYKLRNEAKEYPAPGELVEINKKKCMYIVKVRGILHLFLCLGLAQVTQL